jgi:hypothetical protein
VLDAALMTSTAVATAFLFTSENWAALGWGGAFCIMPWIGRVTLSLATDQPALPVRFGRLGNTTGWMVTDIGIMVLWCVLVVLTCAVFILTVVVLAFDGTDDTRFDMWFAMAFGIVTVAMLRIGVPLILVGTKSSKAIITLARDRPHGA